MRIPMVMIILVMILCVDVGSGANEGTSQGRVYHHDEKRTEPLQVKVGAYFNSVASLDLKLNTYSVDLYLFFKWDSDDYSPANTVEFNNPSEYVLF